MSTRTKSAATNSTVKKGPPVTATLITSGRSVSKMSRSVSKPDIETPVKLLTSRLSVDHKASPRPVDSKPIAESIRKKASDVVLKPVVNSKPIVDARASKLSTAHELEQKRAPKVLDLEARVRVLQEDLKMVKDQLALALKEKAEVVDELKEARKIAGEANEKLSEAVADQKRAEEASEMEKVRVTETARKKEDLWNKEMENLKAQHASEADALLSATREVLRVKKELAEISDAKNQAISLADAKGEELETYREKVVLLTEEITGSKALLESKIEAVELLKLQLEKSRSFGEKLEAKIEELNSDLNDSKLAQAYSNSLVKKWKHQVEELDRRVDTRERSVTESLCSATKRLEEVESLLQESEQKTAILTENIAQTEAAIDDLHIELEASREAEAELRNVVEQWKQKAKDLEKEVEEANLTEKTALDLLSVVKMQVEDTRGFLQEAEKKVIILTEKNAESEGALEQASIQLEASRMAEAYENNLVNEWKQRVEELEDRFEDANGSERAMKESLNSVEKELETARESLQDAEVKIDDLEEKVGLLEMSFERQRGDLKQAEKRAATAEADAFETAKMIETLKIELETAQEEKLQALENEKLTASNVRSLLEEKNKLINELENSRYEEEKSKKAMESLATVLHEVSSEAREAKENFLARQAEHETYESQIDDLKCILKETNEKYETILDDARHEVDSLMVTIEKFKKQFDESKAEWEESKSELVSSVKQSDEAKYALENEINRLIKLLKEHEEGGVIAESDKARLMKSLNESESEVAYMQSVLGEAKSESMKLKESLLENESKLQDSSLENEKLRGRETAALEKIEELSKLLEEAVAKKKIEENGAHVKNGNSHDFHPKSIIPETNEHENEIEQKHENHIAVDEAVLTDSRLFRDMKGDSETDEKQEEKDSSQEKELEEESCDEELVDIGEISFDKRNGYIDHIGNNSTSPSGQKKKKAMLGKFGSLLKKKNNSNTKSHKS